MLIIVHPVNPPTSANPNQTVYTTPSNYNNWRPKHTIEHTLEELKQIFGRTLPGDQKGFTSHHRTEKLK